MMMTDDTVALIAELQRLFDSQPNIYEEPGVTFLELQEATRSGSSQLRMKLRRMIHAGKVEAIRTKRPNVVGTPAYSVVYRPVIQEMTE
jgi:hypothetical protein